MCNAKSMIVLKNRVYCPLDHDHHTKMLEELGIRDDSISPDFVRIEMLPKDKDTFNHDRGNWEIKVDQDLLPDWFMPEEAEQACWKQLEEWFSKRFIREGVRNISEGEWFVSGDAIVHAYCDTIVCARENAIVYAYNNTTIYASGNVIVNAYNTTTIYATREVTVHAGGEANVKAWDTATVYVSCDATVLAGGHANVYVSGDATVCAVGNANVFISKDRSRDVKILKLKGFAIVRDMRSNPPILLTANTFEVKKFEDAACV